MADGNMLEWVEANLSEDERIGLVGIMAIARGWYTNEDAETPEGLHLIFQSMGAANTQNRLRTIVWALRLIYGKDRYASNPALKKFLEAVEGPVLHVLGVQIGEDIQTFHIRMTGRITKDLVDDVINATLIAEVIPESDLGRQIDKDVNLLMSKLDVRLISEEVEAYALAYIDRGEVNENYHPAFDFLLQILSLAPKTRSLPARMTAAVETLMNAKPPQ